MPRSDGTEIRKNQADLDRNVNGVHFDFQATPFPFLKKKGGGGRERERERERERRGREKDNLDIFLQIK